MLEQKEHFHGSDLEKIEQIYGIRKEEITSFGANVNPLGISPLLRSTLAQHIDAITTYPDRDYTSLRKCIAAYTGTDYRNILMGNGSTELISIFIQITRPKKALILGPTYSEYEREISLEGGICLYYPLKEELDFHLDTEEFLSQLDESIHLVVICNPNNPTSTAIPRQDMERILEACSRKHIFVMVDETYVEFAENYEEITALPLTEVYENLVILRGTSKFFAAPGLRLGYAITGNHRLLADINARKNPWTINSLAVIAGEIMFTDKEYIQKTKTFIAGERTKMYDAFSKDSRFKAYQPTANFMLVQILEESLTSQELFDRAIREKMMIRDCSDFPFLNDKYIRFCFMDSEMNDKLIWCLLG